MLEINNIVTEMRNSFDGLVSSLDVTRERNQWAVTQISRNFPNWNAEIAYYLKTFSNIKTSNFPHNYIYQAIKTNFEKKYEIA